MRISIDEETVDKLSTYDGRKLNINELLICMIVLMKGNPANITQNLLNEGVLLKDEITNELYIFRKYKGLVENILLQSDKAVPNISDVEQLTLKLQELFPKERKPDSNGIPRYSYKGNKRDVTVRLQKFFKLYGQYSYDDVYECTKRYVESFKYDKTYMRILPYYIMKDGESTLANELENMSDDSNTDISNSGLNYGEALL